METYDVVIIGAGTGGLSAGVYAARAKRSTLVLDRRRPGGQAATTEMMENYPGFPGGIGGRELMDRFRDHALEMGARIRQADVTGFSEEDGVYVVRTRDGARIGARSVILAPGCEPRKLGVPGEAEFSGRGVSYCATCDAELFEGARICVIGSGETAVEEAGYLSRFASEVVMIVAHDEGILTCNRTQAQTARANPKLTWMWNRSTLAIEGTETVEAVRVRNLKTGEEERVPCEGVFLFVGTVPLTDFIGDFVRTEKGYIPTDERMETDRPLVFAAGDARVKALRQVVTAASDGAIAAWQADRELTEIEEYGKSVKRAGDSYLLYFYSPSVRRSLELVPEVEKRADALGLPLIKLHALRFRNIAARYNVTGAPSLLRIEKEIVKEVLPC
ncbi:MAG TPA: FAD-dependent oxidoreductase [Spirochaetia bacterium]